MCLLYVLNLIYQASILSIPMEALLFIAQPPLPPLLPGAHSRGKPHNSQSLLQHSNNQPIISIHRSVGGFNIAILDFLSQIKAFQQLHWFLFTFPNLLTVLWWELRGGWYELYWPFNKLIWWIVHSKFGKVAKVSASFANGRLKLPPFFLVPTVQSHLLFPLYISSSLLSSANLSSCPAIFWACPQPNGLLSSSSPSSSSSVPAHLS